VARDERTVTRSPGARPGA